jgi:hypothetical protein
MSEPKVNRGACAQTSVCATGGAQIQLPKCDFAPGQLQSITSSVYFRMGPFDSARARGGFVEEDNRRASLHPSERDLTSYSVRVYRGHVGVVL